MKRRLIAILAAALLAIASGATATADPANQPFNEQNCHGYILGHAASGDPEGIGNFFGGQSVQTFQQVIVANLCDELTG